MIIRPRPTPLNLFFIMRGSIVPRIAPQIIGYGLYAALVVWLLRVFHVVIAEPGLAPFTLLGVALSIYLGFRNSASYERWWEARKLWGQLIFDIRNLSRAVLALMGADRSVAREVLMDAIGFSHLLRGQLRGVDTRADAERFVGKRIEAWKASRNPADAAIRAMESRIGAQKAAGALGAIEYQILNERLASLSAVQAGCERIAGTPLPFAYTLLLHRSAYLFCLLLPLGLASTAGWYTPLFTAFVVYTFFGLDTLSEELEEPFGMQPNDLALDALCRVCEISVMEALGEAAPEPMAADRYLYL